LLAAGENLGIHLMVLNEGKEISFTKIKGTSYLTHLSAFIQTSFYSTIVNTWKIQYDSMSCFFGVNAV
jgi:hypothetical protein